jgi:serine/threonine-protein kinase
MDELLDVLAAAHAQGIIHRDIKLDNLFITQSGALKVLDFGIARVRESASMTMVGARLGTLPYMPPEQMRGIPIDGRADLFAVGAVMFRLIAKRRIHEARSEAELIAQMSSRPAPPLVAVAPDAPTDVCLVVDRALAFERDVRYPDAQTMQEDVKAVRRGDPPPYATRKMVELGPPNPVSGDASGLGPIATRAATPLALHGPAEPTAATRAGGESRAVVGTGEMVSAHEPTAAGASVGAVVGTGEMVSAHEPTAAATPFTAAGVERTALSSGSGALAGAPPALRAASQPGATMLSAGVPAVSGAAPMSGLLEPTMVSGVPRPRETGPRQPWLAMLMAGVLIMLLVVGVVAWSLSGRDDAEGAENAETDTTSESGTRPAAGEPSSTAETATAPTSDERGTVSPVSTPAGNAVAPRPGSPIAPSPTPAGAPVNNNQPRPAPPIAPNPSPQVQPPPLPVPPLGELPQGRPSHGHGKGKDKDKDKDD